MSIVQRDEIKGKGTNWVVACFTRGRIFSEHQELAKARKKTAKYSCLDRDNYAIYSREEWNRRRAFDFAVPEKVYPFQHQRAGANPLIPWTPEAQREFDERCGAKKK